MTGSQDGRGRSAQGVLLGAALLLLACAAWWFARAGGPPPRPHPGEAVGDDVRLGEERDTAALGDRGRGIGLVGGADHRAEVPVRDGAGGVGSDGSWTIELRPLLASGVAPASVVVAMGMPSRRWRPEGAGHERLEVDEDGVARLELDLPLADLLAAGMRVGTTSGALSCLDGRLMTGSVGVEGVGVALAQAAMDPERRVLDAGEVRLEPPTTLGSAVLEGGWPGPVRILVRCDPEFSAVSQPAMATTRTIEVRPGDPPPTFHCYFPGDQWSVQAVPVDEGLLASPVRAVAAVGSDVVLRFEPATGLELSVDLTAAPAASRLVARPVEAPRPEALDPDGYRAHLEGAVWTNVVPRSLVKAGRPSYHIGRTRLPEGGLRLELWSIEDEGRVRRLLAAREVSVGTDMLLVRLP